jgi:hypothetical protein
LLWAPYSEDTYREVLICIQPDDIVLEIGAGDMRLAAQIANIARHIYALEVQYFLVEYAFEQDLHLLPNLTILHKDARTFPFPTGITTSVLLMRHCTHFRLYANKLKSVGCEKLITNARWRTGLEVIQLQSPRLLFDQIPMGWYACWCGNTGFKPGPVEALDEETANIVHEVMNCPNCVTYSG